MVALIYVVEQPIWRSSRKRRRKQDFPTILFLFSLQLSVFPSLFLFLFFSLSSCASSGAYIFIQHCCIACYTDAIQVGGGRWGRFKIILSCLQVVVVARSVMPSPQCIHKSLIRDYPTAKQHRTGASSSSPSCFYFPNSIAYI